MSTDVQELLGIVGDDAVDLGPDAPSHHVDVVDRPDEDGPVGGLSVVKEPPSGRTEQDLLQQVEGYVGDLEELSSVREVESDMRDGKAGEVSITSGQENRLERGGGEGGSDQLTGGSQETIRTVQQPKTIR